MYSIVIDENRLADIDRFIQAHQSDLVRDISRLVSIPSVEGPAAPGAPFGVESRRALDHADIILAKGQGNYESLSGQGRHVFYAFLCKCELFTSRFNVLPLTGMLVEELGA